jgi:hypothetical protein
MVGIACACFNLSPNEIENVVKVAPGLHVGKRVASKKRALYRRW